MIDRPSGGASRRRGRGEARAARGRRGAFHVHRGAFVGRRSIKHFRSIRSHSTVIVVAPFRLPAPRGESSGRHFARAPSRARRLGEARAATISPCLRLSSAAPSRSIQVSARQPSRRRAMRSVVVFSPPHRSALPTDDVSRIRRRSNLAAFADAAPSASPPVRAHSQAPTPTRSAPPSATCSSSSFPSGAPSRTFPSR